jgi:hypothetical protein
VILERFRLAHWPFHVWWRYTITKLRARDKARFLVAVYRMYMKVRLAKRHSKSGLELDVYMSPMVKGEQQSSDAFLHRAVPPLAGLMTEPVCLYVSSCACSTP